MKNTEQFFETENNDNEIYFVGGTGSLYIVQTGLGLSVAQAGLQLKAIILPSLPGDCIKSV